MTTNTCPVCDLPWLSRPEGEAEGIHGFLGNSGDDHSAGEARHVLEQTRSDVRYAIKKDDLEASDILRQLSVFQAPIDPEYTPPEGGKKTLTTGIAVLLRGPGNGQKFILYNVAHT
jgi:hypothetical protein